MIQRELLRLMGVPVYQNKMFQTSEEAKACPRGDVVLTQDSLTGIVNNIAFDSAKLQYDESYQNEQGHSAAFQEHLSEVLETLQRHFQSASVLEVGCGKGGFLEQLRQTGLDAWGIDPAYEGNSPYIIKAAFSPDRGMRRDAIVMRHVLEHIPQPIEFLDSIRMANGEQGLIYIEVPCLDWILRQRAWFDIFYEHVNYFQLSDFDRIFTNVRESGHLFGGQYLYAIADLGSLRRTESILPARRTLIPTDFFGSIARCVATARTDIPHVIWGCGAKGVMFAHHSVASGLEIDFAIDLNPAKQGRFLAGTGISVVSPDEGMRQLGSKADVFVMNSNYLSEIKTLAGPSLHYIPLDQT